MTEYDIAKYKEAQPSPNFTNKPDQIPPFWSTAYQYRSFNDPAFANMSLPTTLDHQKLASMAPNSNAPQGHSSFREASPKSSLYDPHHPTLNFGNPSSNFAFSTQGNVHLLDGTAHSTSDFITNRLNDHSTSVKDISTQLPTTRDITKAYRNHAAQDSDLEEGELSADELEEDLTGVQDQMFSNKRDMAAKELWLIKKDLDTAQVLVKDLYDWGLSFDDMMKEVTNAEALRSVFVSAGLPINESISSTYNQMVVDQEVPAGRTTENGQIADHTSGQHPNNTAPALIVAEPPPLDRKALIAQKLAAKKAQAPKDQSKQDPTAHFKSSPGKAQDKASTSSFSYPDGLSNAPLELSSDMASQRRAQTELARQKMEALKQKRSGGRPNEGAGAAPPPAKTIGKNPSLPPQTNSMADSSYPAAVPSLELSRRESYFSPISPASAFNIPGLFSIANAPVDRADQRKLSSKGSTSPLTSSKDTLRDTHGGQEQLPAPDVNISTNDDESLEEAATPNKRQKMMDSKDSPAKSFGFTLDRDDVGVIIEISDHGSDTAETMSVDPEGTTSRGTGNQHSRSSEFEVHDTGTAGNPTFRKKSFGSAHGNTSEYTTTPKLQDPEDLRAKEMEIESMNRKIAELQANAKAKKARQFASQLQSPVKSQTSRETSSAASVQEPRDMPQVSRLQSYEVAPVELNTLAGSATGRPLSPKRSVSHRSPDVDTSLGTALRLNGPTLSGQDFNQNSSPSNDDPSLTASTHEAHVPRFNPSQDLEISPSDRVGELDHGSVTKQDSRRIEIEAGLPLLDEEIRISQAKLSALRQQEEQLEAEIRRGLAGKKRLLEELQRLSHTLMQPNHETEILSTTSEKEYTTNEAVAPSKSMGSEVAHVVADGHEVEGLPRSETRLSDHDIAMEESPGPDAGNTGDNDMIANDAGRHEATDNISSWSAEQEDALMNLSPTGMDSEQVGLDHTDNDQVHAGHSPNSYQNAVKIPEIISLHADGENVETEMMDNDHENVKLSQDSDDNVELYEPDDDLIFGFEDKEAYEPSMEPISINSISPQAESATKPSTIHPNTHLTETKVPDSASKRGLDTASLVSYEPPAVTFPDDITHQHPQQDLESSFALQQRTASSHTNSNQSDDEYEPPEPHASAELPNEGPTQVIEELDSVEPRMKKEAVTDVGNLDEA